MTIDTDQFVGAMLALKDRLHKISESCQTSANVCELCGCMLATEYYNATLKDGSIVKLCGPCGDAKG